jgi:hypothetical protein
MALQIAEVQKALKGVEYPASRDELARHAEGNGADRGAGRRPPHHEPALLRRPERRHEGAEGLADRLQRLTAAVIWLLAQPADGT